MSPTRLSPKRPAAAGERDAKGVPGVASLEVGDDDVPEHPLGVRAGALEVEGQGRQAAQDDPDPWSSHAGRGQALPAATRAGIAPAADRRPADAPRRREAALRTIRLAERSIELPERLGKDFSRLRRLRLVSGLDADLADRDTPRPEEPQPALDGLADSRQRVASTDERVAVARTASTSLSSSR